MTRKEKSAPDRVRPYDRIVQAVLELLNEADAAAVSTRAITQRAGVQAPALYRLFGDKDGLLVAAAEHAYATWVQQKRDAPAGADPVEVLRAGWDETVQFGLDHPAVYRIVNARSIPGPATDIGRARLLEKVKQVAREGRLRVSTEQAAAMLHATGRGVILTLLDTPPESRTLHLSDLARESTIAAVTTDATEQQPSLRTTASALRELLPTTKALQIPEWQLMDLWLQRIVSDTPDTAVAGQVQPRSTRANLEPAGNQRPGETHTHWRQQ